MHTTGKGSNSSYSPSFNSYYNNGLAVIAARVTTEFPDDEDFTLTELKSSGNGALDAKSVCAEDEDFEFDLSNLKLDDGEIRPVYPVFNRDLLREVDDDQSRSEKADFCGATIQLQILDPLSSSSSEADEMEEVPEGTYCIWAPNKSAAASPSPGRCTKSNSTGSSVTVAGKAKSWKLRDFLKRSKSDGKQGLMMLTQKKVEAPAVRARQSKSPAVRGETKRRSYLPYRQDLVGLFATPHAFRNMNLPPF